MHIFHSLEFLFGWGRVCLGSRHVFSSNKYKSKLEVMNVEKLTKWQFDYISEGLEPFLPTSK